MEGGDGLEDSFCDASLVEEGKGVLGDLEDNALKEALAFGGTAFLISRGWFIGGGRCGGR